jgi:hypothetical protein
MLMEKKPRGLLKESIVMLDLMTGQEKMDYLERMWDLYIRVYERPRYIRKRSRTFVMDKTKAYDLCSKLTKIFGH